jgi:hypothetical protein
MQGTSSSYFSTSGALARPAGVAGLFASLPGSGNKEFEYGTSLPKATGLREHALRRHTPYAEVVPAGWEAKEPKVQPNAGVVGAGVVSAGSIDNTYVPIPLANRWGKARERAKNEIDVPPHKQATDLLIVAKGAPAGHLAGVAAPDQTSGEMNSVRPLYSKTIPLFHPIDPQRQESGFIRSPNIIPGALPAPQSALLGVGDLPAVPNDHQLKKLAYNQSMEGTGRIPVSRLVHASLPQADTGVPSFFSRPAGLPGGLSIIN